MKKTMRNSVLVTAILMALAFVIAMPTHAMGTKETKVQTQTQTQQTNPDAGLSIEELRKKYPIDWYHKEYGDSSSCTYKYKEISPTEDRANELYTPERCDPKVMITNMTNENIKSLFVNYDNTRDFRVFEIIVSVMNSINNNQKPSKYYEIKTTIYSKAVLMNMNATLEEVIQAVPESLPYYKEVMMVWVRHNSQTQYHLSEKYREDPEVKKAAEEHIENNKEYYKKLKESYIKMKKKKLKREEASKK